MAEEPEPIFRCEICNKNFGSKEALEMHNKAKHSQSNEQSKSTAPEKANFKKIRNRGMFVVILALVALGIYYLFSMAGSSGNDLPASQINIRSHQNIALHMHSDLSIKVNGTEQEIPTNIGILSGIMRPLHTHDSSGEIHIEGPSPRNFRLGEFFEIWGRTFNETCIFEHCVVLGSNSTLTMKVNGIESQQFENYIFRDDDKILIEFSSFEIQNKSASNSTNKSK